MYEKKTKKLSATIEMLSLYINLKERKVAEFESEKVNIMQTYIKENKDKFLTNNLVITGKLKK